MLLEGTLILSCWHSEVVWPVAFLTAFNFPSVATRYPNAAGWTVSEYPNYDLRVQLQVLMFCSAVKCLNHLASNPLSTKTPNIYHILRKVSDFPMLNKTTNLVGTEEYTAVSCPCSCQSRCFVTCTHYKLLCSLQHCRER